MSYSVTQPQGEKTDRSYRSSSQGIVSDLMSYPSGYQTTNETGMRLLVLIGEWRYEDACYYYVKAVSEQFLSQCQSQVWLKGRVPHLLFTPFPIACLYTWFCHF